MEPVTLFHRESVFSLGPCIAQPLAALPLTDAAYPLRVRPVLFLPPQKENGGWIPAGKAGIVPALWQRENQRLFGKNEKKMRGAMVDKTGKIGYNTPAYGDEEDQYPSWRCKENPWYGEKGRASGGEYTLEPAPQRPLTQ